jgi:hypothetical protein
MTCVIQSYLPNDEYEYPLPDRGAALGRLVPMKTCVLVKNIPSGTVKPLVLPTEALPFGLVESISVEETRDPASKTHGPPPPMPPYRLHVMKTTGGRESLLYHNAAALKAGQRIPRVSLALGPLASDQDAAHPEIKRVKAVTGHAMGFRMIAAASITSLSIEPVTELPSAIMITYYGANVVMGEGVSPPPLADFQAPAEALDESVGEHSDDGEDTRASGDATSGEPVASSDSDVSGVEEHKSCAESNVDRIVTEACLPGADDAELQASMPTLTSCHVPCEKSDNDDTTLDSVRDDSAIAHGAGDGVDDGDSKTLHGTGDDDNAGAALEHDDDEERYLAHLAACAATEEAQGYRPPSPPRLTEPSAAVTSPALVHSSGLDAHDDVTDPAVSGTKNAAPDTEGVKTEAGERCPHDTSEHESCAAPPVTHLPLDTVRKAMGAGRPVPIMMKFLSRQDRLDMNQFV